MRSPVIRYPLAGRRPRAAGLESLCPEDHAAAFPHAELKDVAGAEAWALGPERRILLDELPALPQDQAIGARHRSVRLLEAEGETAPAQPVRFPGHAVEADHLPYLGLYHPWRAAFNPRVPPLSPHWLSGAHRRWTCAKMEKKS